ncbi:MAG: hypothetical protein FK734_16410 [Asgard group archaeon]|nr:hypothetical protein [Asgard group archaeon]
MRKNRVFTTGFILTLTCILMLNGIGTANAVVPINTIISYVAVDDSITVVGQNITATNVIKNYLNDTESLRNVTLEITIDSELNITNVNNLSADMSSYNSTTYFLTEINSTTPIYWFNSTYINVTWSKFDQYMNHTFWFELNCTTAGQFAIENPIITYLFYNGTAYEEVSDTGIGILINVLEDLPPPEISSPIRGEWEIYWWFVGGLLIAAPIIIIVITRLTLWKR